MYVGRSVKRDEDRRLLVGRSTFTDDLELPGAAHAVIVRSPHAHARIVSIDIEAAARAPGVLAILTGADWSRAGLGELPCIADIDSSDGTAMRSVLRPVLAGASVHHVGDAVAAVIGESPEQATAAAEQVLVEYDDLPAVVAASDAVGDNTVAHLSLGTNLAHWREEGDAEATEAAFQCAQHVARYEFVHTRVTGSAIEPRAYAARYDESSARYTLWAAGQNPHFLRRLLATHVLRVPVSRLRVICPAVGGGFGTKYYCYPEQAIVLRAAMLLRRPVRWLATRTEALTSDTHARDHSVRAAMALDADGIIKAIRCEVTASYGAYQSTFAPIIVMQSVAGTLPGPYRVPAGHLRTKGVYTNTTPVDAYRGTKQLSAMIHEGLIDTAARELGIDPVEIRKRNYLSTEDYPHTHVFGHTYDSGNAPLQHETLARIADYGALCEERTRARRKGRLMGLGVASVVESTGLGPSRQIATRGVAFGGWEAARVSVHPDGKVSLYVGTHSHGQSHETTFRQIAADGLGVPMDDVEFSQGDTDLGPGNLGTAAARSLSTAGMGVVEAARRVIDKGARLAAHLLECAEQDVSYQDGFFIIAGTDRKLAFAAVAEAAHSAASYPHDGFEPGMEETVHYDPLAFGYPTALHLAVVLVDSDTGEVRIRDYFTVDDCGRVINPMVVRGQVHGGLAQGVGQALMEQIVYDADSGQLLSGSFMDYCLPRADQFPPFALEFQETLNPNNALGAKGCSETGIVGAPIAVSNAILDALWPMGVRALDFPYTSERVWRAMRAAGEKSGATVEGKK